jgi:anti-anti-sigma regulatory factor
MTDCILIVDLDRLSDSEFLPALKARVGAILEHGATGIIFNGRHVEMVDSTIIGYLFWVQQDLKNRGAGGEAVVTAPSRFLHQAITMVGLQTTLRIFDTDEEALTYLRAGE